MSLFCCPLCAAPLERAAGAYRCPGGHSFDIAKEGYVHLLPPNQKHSALPGDDREMVLARREFLSGGYYRLLLNTLCSRILALSGETPALLDAGCGEGWYTAGVAQALRAAGRRPQIAGTDISKFALRTAARREKGAEFAVASSYRLPLADGGVDVLLNCFSPLALEEFRRVLRPGGWFLYVVPGAEHLWEMKEILYDKPYPNEEKETLRGLRLSGDCPGGRDGFAGAAGGPSKPLPHDPLFLENPQGRGGAPGGLGPAGGADLLPGACV